MAKRIYICAPMENVVDVSNAAKYADFVLRCGCAPFAPHFYSMCAENGRGLALPGLAKLGRSFLWCCDEIWVFGSRMTRRMKEEISFCKHLNIKAQYVHDRIP